MLEILNKTSVLLAIGIVGSFVGSALVAFGSYRMGMQEGIRRTTVVYEQEIENIHNANAPEND